jgi:hypothetical protein
MKLPTPEEIAKAKADAFARFGRDEALLVSLSAPIDFALFVAPLNLKRYCALVDAQSRDMSTSFGAAALDALLWPDQDAWLEVAKLRPAAPRKVVVRMLARAGKDDASATVKQLADLVAAFVPGKDDAALAVLAPNKVRGIIPGLSADKARELLAAEAARAEPRELWAIDGPGLSCVMAAPDADVFLASNVAIERANMKDEGITEARLGFTRDAIIWSERPLDVVLDDKPAITSDLTKAWLTMGGEVAEATSRSF